MEAEWEWGAGAASNRGSSRGMIYASSKKRGIISLLASHVCSQKTMRSTHVAYSGCIQPMKD